MVARWLCPGSTRVSLEGQDKSTPPWNQLGSSNRHRCEGSPHALRKTQTQSIGLRSREEPYESVRHHLLTLRGLLFPGALVISSSRSENTNCTDLT